MRHLKLNPPQLTLQDAERATALFGVQGTVRELYSERDQNFLVTAGGESQFVLKIATVEDQTGEVELQLAALKHVREVNPQLPIPVIRHSESGEEYLEFTTAAGVTHLAFMVSFLPGVLIEDSPINGDLLYDHGRMIARLGQALSGLFHPSAGRELLWDIRQLPKLKQFCDRAPSREHRLILSRTIDSFSSETLPNLKVCRAQIIHGDANGHNVLVDVTQPHRVAGIIDFGDLYHGPLLNDLAVAITDVLMSRSRDRSEVQAIIRGYNETVPLQPVEIGLLFDCLTARLALTALISLYRRTELPTRLDYNHIYEAPSVAWLDELHSLGREEVTGWVREACGVRDDKAIKVKGPARDLLSRRQRLMNPRMQLFYDAPLHIVRGEGVWLFDATGRRYLDVYNNVPHVGHCHPKVVEAITRQVSTLNTNTRYLGEQVVALAERLGEHLPGDLKVCAFVNSGSEANDLAWRMAKAFSGHTGGLLMESAYHGITDAIDAFSPAERRIPREDHHIETLTAPDRYRGPYKTDCPDTARRYASDADRAIARLAARGVKPAAFLVDSTFLTNGVLEAPRGYLDAVFKKVHAAGGLCIADEVQAGFGRMGNFMWGHQTYGVFPDIVTIGKPAGNGHPIGVVITRMEIMDALLDQTSFFSTFGGNNVSCAAGLAVLDIIKEEGLIENSGRVGAYLKNALRNLMHRHEIIGDVRGHGLVIGVELVTDQISQQPARNETRWVVNALCRRGILIGSEGPHGCVLKIRPPIVFNVKHADMVIENLDEVLNECREQMSS
ncbi:4-aminobutyrate aminotransferase-like enzyme/Ser/Thr protein kinase RdoA (MazF antagonist) [Rhodoligotrophos appendicifer]|uniref:aminotransferase class III-fold pyridoxal phosphate-dependent enzyme n=1 Tax=Rhodoligotrophos appendicifer TaxID=987056 RepID=UPI0014791489|nr:aminotransferase class III-fold pyridoxal phosphate-dependent enzyme [Rhodoligotrophos appendicifer]